MNISEQVNKLREAVKSYRPYVPYYVIGLLHNAADTIESLSAKLQAKEYCDGCPGADIIEIPCTEECKRRHFKAENMQRPGEDCGGWIPCKDRLPDVEVSENVKSGICTDNGERFLITDTEGYVYESTFWLSTQEFEDDAIAWMPKPEPYHEP